MFDDTCDEVNDRVKSSATTDMNMREVVTYFTKNKQEGNFDFVMQEEKTYESKVHIDIL